MILFLLETFLDLNEPDAALRTALSVHADLRPSECDTILAGHIIEESMIQRYPYIAAPPR